MTEPFIIPVQLRWSDFDANFHLRHSAFYDFGALARIALFTHIGLSAEIFQQHQFGPILFRESCIFRKEVKMTDMLHIETSLIECRPNGSRFAFAHRMVVNQHHTAAELTVHGDYIDFKTRRLWQPLPFLSECFEKIPRHPEFRWLPA